MKKLGIAGLAITGLLVTSSVASAQVLCVLPLMFSAAVVSAQENRELTQREANWCGLVRDTEAGQKKAATPKKKKTRKAKKQ